jgi:uncharacterized SAM-binding protein YcdF (DUF218 family)
LFFTLSKIFQYLFTPIFWIVFIFVLSFIVGNDLKIKNCTILSNAPKKLRITSLCMLLFFSNPFIYNAAMGLWEPDIKHKDELMPYYDYAIVLTGVLSYNDDYERISFKSSSDRFLQALELYKQGRIGKIFLPGGSAHISQEYKESKILKDYLVLLCIPDSVVEIETLSRNTYENAVESAMYFKEDLQNKKILLITSGFHMRRASACFRKQGFVFDTYVTDLYASKRTFSIEMLLFPKAEALQGWSRLTHEMSGYIIYKLSGKL